MLRRRAKRIVESDEIESVDKPKKQKAVVEDKSDEVEKHLEKLLFGEASSLDAFATETKDVYSESEEENEDSIGLNKEIPTQRQPKWIDDDDALERFEKIYGDGSWASLDKKRTYGSEDEEDELLQTTGNYLSRKSDVLPRDILSIKRVKDANSEKPSNAGIQRVEFHPSAKVLLTAGLNKTLDLFQIDGQNNPKLQSVFIDKFPINDAHFSADGEQVIMTSKRKHFYVYDMMKGQVVKIPRIRGRKEKYFNKFDVSPDNEHIAFIGENGYIVLVSSKSKQWIANLKMNGQVGAVSFSADGSKLYSTGSDGEVYIWDVKSRTCLHKFTDEGCLSGTTVASSRNGQYLACGSDSGIVNIYDDQCYTKSYPKPLKTISNLTTSINGTAFNSSSELLGLYSNSKKDSFKLVHIPSFTVFSNWPNNKIHLKYVQTFDFSPNSGFLSIGNDKGKALLFRLNHYTDS